MKWITSHQHFETRKRRRQYHGIVNPNNHLTTKRLKRNKAISIEPANAHYSRNTFRRFQLHSLYLCEDRSDGLPTSSSLAEHNSEHTCSREATSARFTSVGAYVQNRINAQTCMQCMKCAISSRKHVTFTIAFWWICYFQTLRSLFAISRALSTHIYFWHPAPKTHLRASYSVFRGERWESQEVPSWAKTSWRPSWRAVKAAWSKIRIPPKIVRKWHLSLSVILICMNNGIINLY